MKAFEYRGKGKKGPQCFKIVKTEDNCRERSRLSQLKTLSDDFKFIVNHTDFFF